MPFIAVRMYVCDFLCMFFCGVVLVLPCCGRGSGLTVFGACTAAVRWRQVAFSGGQYSDPALNRLAIAHRCTWDAVFLHSFLAGASIS